MPRRGESIYKRKDGRWEARFVKEITADGKKKYGSVYAESYKAVKDKQQLHLFSLPSGNDKLPSVKTVSELLEQWMYHIKPTVKAATYQKYEGLSANHIKPEIGHLQLKFINRSTLDRFAQSQMLNGRYGGGALSPKTVNDILVILGMAFGFAEEEYGLSMPRVTFLRDKKKEARVLSDTEEKKLLAELMRDMDTSKFGILLAMYTGMRIGELCALKWEDITDEAIDVSKTVQRLKSPLGKTSLVFGEPKSRSSKRLIPIPQFLLPFIEEFRKGDGYVLQTKRGTPTEPRTLQLKFGKITATCGLENVNFHALRHTFATRCVEAGIDVKSLSEILGHSDVKTTLNRYVHSSFSFKQENIQKLNLPLLSAM